jgi:tetratricopeptide (TPR) repeat protein
VPAVADVVDAAKPGLTQRAPKQLELVLAHLWMLLGDGRHGTMVLDQPHTPLDLRARRGLEIAQATIPIDEFQGRMMTGYAYRMRKEYDASIAQYEALLTQYPDSATIFGACGYTWLAAGRDGDALDCFQRWVGLAEHDAEAYTGLGDGYRALEEFETAAAAYQKALAIDPYWSEARYSIAQILDERKDYTAARKEYAFIANETPEFRLASKAKKRAYQLKKKKY